MTGPVRSSSATRGSGSVHRHQEGQSRCATTSAEGPTRPRPPVPDMGYVIAFAAVAVAFAVWLFATGGLDPIRRREQRMARQERRRARYGDPGVWRGDR